MSSVPPLPGLGLLHDHWPAGPRHGRRGGLAVNYGILGDRRHAMNPHLMNALANSPVFWVALILGLLALYILPSVIGAIRGVEGLGWIVVINLLPSGIGWIAALI